MESKSNLLKRVESVCLKMHVSQCQWWACSHSQWIQWCCRQIAWPFTQLEYQLGWREETYWYSSYNIAKILVWKITQTSHKNNASYETFI